MLSQWNILEGAEINYKEDNENTYDYLDIYSSKEDDSDEYSYQEEFIKHSKSKAVHLEVNKDPPLQYHHGDGSFSRSQSILDTNLLVIFSFIALVVVMVTLVVIIFRRQNKTMVRRNFSLHRCIHAQQGADEDFIFCSIHGHVEKPLSCIQLN